MRRRLMAALSAAVMMAGLVVGQGSAQAATTGWVYISFPTWLANCESGGRVTAIQAYTDYWSTNWDTGDDLVYGKVALGQRNKIIATVFCSKWPAGYYRYVARTDVVPTRNNQTLWVGPAGWSRN
ncbi:hypothetical protein [Lentzea sp. NPDC060358]|uniref:hypothetical protein n=1 Tax=Lentzea sp. NPDC060358 TaxID=3347103 RepID=UPI00364C8809